MYLAYFDDSDTKAKKQKWQVMSAVIVKDRSFYAVEAVMGAVVEDLVPPDKLDEFTEFKACQLYGGYGVFEGIPQAKRFRAIEDLLRLIVDGPDLLP